MNQNGEHVLDVGVDFQGVSIGQTTARLGVKIDRERLNIVAADEIFCGHRLTGRVVLGHEDDTPGQSTLWEDADIAVDGSFDCKTLTLKATYLSTGLTFSLPDIDIGELAKFSSKQGRLVVLTVAEIPEDTSDDEHEHVPGTLAADGPWRDVELSGLFDGALLKKLKAAGLTTVGELSDWTAADKRLTDIEGIGAAAEQKIEDRMLEFWADNKELEEV